MPKPICCCGCGMSVQKDSSRYRSGHNSKVKHPMKGKHHTDTSKKKISETIKQQLTQL